MTAFRRWRDYVTMVLGLVLILTPPVFGDTGQAVAAMSAYILGALILLSGVLTAAMREENGAEVVPGILAVVTFVAPWVLGFSGVTAVAWVSWIVGVLVFANAGEMLWRVTGSRRLAA
jgi:SPW repeat